MDIAMPIMDGYECTLKIREHESKSLTEYEPRATIIALSGHSTEAYKAQGLKCGMNDFSKIWISIKLYNLVTKPIEMEHLKNVLSNLSNQK